jgi:hypothetical protein
MLGDDVAGIVCGALVWQGSQCFVTERAVKLEAVGSLTHSSVVDGRIVHANEPSMRSHRDDNTLVPRRAQARESRPLVHAGRLGCLGC